MTEITFITSSGIPSTLHGPGFQLRPLQTTDVELDYDAVMSSRAMLRRWSQSDWPADDFPLEGNLADLERHQREHDAGIAFTYTVTTPGNDRCLGCVYINPLAPELIETGICSQPEAGKTTAVSVRFWVRTSLLGTDLERDLLLELREWFSREWPVDCVVFLTSDSENRQQAFWESNGLYQRHSFDAAGNTWIAYQAT